MADLSSAAETVRVAIYRTFASTGRALDREQAATLVGLERAQTDAAFRELADARHIVLGADDQIVMAHPFAAINLHFSVMGERTVWWGGCAWDSFAIPHLIPGEPSVLVATTCAACGTPHAWTVTTDAPPEGDQVAHFLVPTARIWDDVVHTCSHQRVFCNETCVENWLTASGNQRGSVFDLATLWRLAKGWYAGRLDSPYRRRELAEAHDYFRQAGLRGEFWGVE